MFTIYVFRENKLNPVRQTQFFRLPESFAFWDLPSEMMWVTLVVFHHVHKPHSVQQLPAVRLKAYMKTMRVHQRTFGNLATTDRRRDAEAFFSSVLGDLHGQS